jgi:phosphate transport system substrate-binding protein
MEVGAKAVPAVAALAKSDSKAFDKAWKSIRKDGAYVEAGENDNVIVQKLEANKNAFGIFGFSFLEENLAKLRGVAIDGVEPDYDSIAGGKYKGSRPLFVYMKKQHVGVIPGMDKFAAEYVSAKAMSKDGYLARKGLVALPKAEADKVANDVKALKILGSDDVKS